MCAQRFWAADAVLYILSLLICLDRFLWCTLLCICSIDTRHVCATIAITACHGPDENNRGLDKRRKSSTHERSNFFDWRSSTKRRFSSAYRAYNPINFLVGRFAGGLYSGEQCSPVWRCIQCFPHFSDTTPPEHRWSWLCSAQGDEFSVTNEDSSARAEVAKAKRLQEAKVS